MDENNFVEIAHFNSHCCECRKWFQRTCGLFFLVCIVSGATFAYCASALTSIRELSIACKDINAENKADIGGEKTADVINRLNMQDMRRDSDVDVTTINHGRPRNKRSTKKKCKLPKLMVGHYEQKATTTHFGNFSDYTHGQMTKTCKYVDELKGTLCKAGDFKSDEKALHVFKLTAKLKPKQSPFKPIKNGQFVARKKGIYLVFAQVVFYDNMKRQEMKVKHWDKKGDSVVNEYSCIRSGVGKNANNTCSITTLCFLGKGDYLTVEVFDTDMTLNLLNNATFFGAILLR